MRRRPRPRPPPKAEARPAAPSSPAAPVPAPTVQDRARPKLITAAPQIVFMVDSTGQLRIEIPDHPPIVCSRDETRDAGRLMISTEPVWS